MRCVAEAILAAHDCIRLRVIDAKSVSPAMICYQAADSGPAVATPCRQPAPERRPGPHPRGGGPGLPGADQGSEYRRRCPSLAPT